MRDDSGFTLMETIVSITLLGIIMTATAAFFITANSSTSDLRRRQVAVQLVDDALEQARSFSASNLLAGRDQTTEKAQWLAAKSPISATNPWGNVAPWLTDTNEAWDVNPATAIDGATCSRSNTIAAGAPLCLPTVPLVQTVNGIEFQVNTYIGQCWQPVGATTCTASVASAPTGVPFYRVVAATSWQGKSCPVGGCTYISAQLINSTGVDAIFNINPVVAVNSAPHVIVPSSPQNTVSTATNPVPVQLQMVATGGTGGLTWTMTGAPTGLRIDEASGLIYGIAPTNAKTWSSVVVTATDAVNKSDSTPAFSWVMNKPPTLTVPAPGATFTATVGRPFTLTPVTADGTKPFSWTATGLPAGLSLATATGIISGTPTGSPSAATVTLSLTDASLVAATSSFTLNVVPPPSLASISDQRSQRGSAITNVTVTATGNSPFTWSLSGAPAGISINSAGVLSGTPTGAPGSYSTTVTATDPTGATGTTTFTWIIEYPLTVANYGNLISWPTDTVSTTWTSTGGAQPVTWSATGLPAGLSINPGTGTVAGTPTTVGNTSTVVTATDSAGAVKSVSFTWTVKLRSGPTKNSNGLCVDVYNFATADTSPVGDYSCNNGPNQSFTFEANGTISTSYLNVTKCLGTDAGFSPARVEIFTCNANDPKQLWQSISNGAVINIVNQAAPKLCLDAPVAGSSPQVLDVQACAADPRRAWVLPS